MKYRATALCLILISLDFQSSLYCVRMRSTHFFNRRAVSYFCQSFSPCSHTHTQKRRLYYNYEEQVVYGQRWLMMRMGLEFHTLILELGFNMMYLMEPWMFSVQEASQVTLLSCRTSFHFVPGGGLGCFESLKQKNPQIPECV